MPRSATFAALDPANRRVLFDWLGDPAAAHIDTAIDMSLRPWNVAGAVNVIGIFEPGRTAASWLVVQDASGWFLLTCATGAVSETCPALADVLELIIG
jgi:hypothetical protein